VRKLAICYAWEPPFAYAEFMEHALNIRCPKGWEMRWFRGMAWCVSRSRSKAFEDALSWGADAICLVDTDHVYEPDVMCRLIARFEDGYEIVAPRIPMRGYIRKLGFKPFQKLGWRFDDKARSGEISVVDSKLIPIDPKDGDIQWAELPNPGTLLFPAKFLRGMQRPWLYEFIDRETFGLKGGGDTYFVRRLQVENSAKAWIDTTIEVKHLNIFAIDETYSERFSDWSEPGVGDPRLCNFDDVGKRVR